VVGPFLGNDLKNLTRGFKENCFSLKLKPIRPKVDRSQAFPIGPWAPANRARDEPQRGSAMVVVRCLRWMGWVGRGFDGKVKRCGVVEVQAVCLKH